MSNYNELKLTYQGGRQETITLTADTIDYGAYQDRNIVAVEVPEIVQTIGDYAFCDNNSLANIVLNEGLQRIEGQAFQHGVYTAVTIPSTVTEIGVNSFNTKDEQDIDQHTFTLTCLATTPPELEDWEGITFGDPNLLSAIYVPDGSVSAYQEAWSAYASKIQGGTPAPTGNIFTNLNIASAYVGDDEVVKMYLGNDAVWEKVEEPEVQLFYNGQLVTGTSAGGVTRIYLNSTDTSVTFDVRTKNQSTPWVIIDYYYPIAAYAQGTGSTSNVSMEVDPNSQDFMGFPKIMKYKQEGDQDGDDAETKWTGWTGEACWFGFRLNNA